MQSVLPGAAQIARSLPPASAITLLNGLAAYWKLDELTGTRADSSGNGNTLTDNNTTLFSVGKVGNAAQFVAASSQYLSIADNVMLSGGNVNFTVACGCFFDSLLSIGQTLVSKYTIPGNQREYCLFYNHTDHVPNDCFSFIVSSTGADAVFLDAAAFGAASISTWYYVCAWHDSVADTINLQINGGTVFSASHSSGVFDGSSSFRIGALATSGPNFLMNGRLDEAKMWRRVLTPDERALDYANFLAGAPLF